MKVAAFLALGLASAALAQEDVFISTCAGRCSQTGSTLTQSDLLALYTTQFNAGLVLTSQTGTTNNGGTIVNGGSTVITGGTTNGLTQAQIDAAIAQWNLQNGGNNLIATDAPTDAATDAPAGRRLLQDNVVFTCNCDTTCLDDDSCCDDYEQMCFHVVARVGGGWTFSPSYNVPLAVNSVVVENVPTTVTVPVTVPYSVPVINYAVEQVNVGIVQANPVAIIKAVPVAVPVINVVPVANPVGVPIAVPYAVTNVVGVPVAVNKPVTTTVNVPVAVPTGFAVPISVAQPVIVQNPVVIGVPNPVAIPQTITVANPYSIVNAAPFMVPVPVADVRQVNIPYGIPVVQNVPVNMPYTVEIPTTVMVDTDVQVTVPYGVAVPYAVAVTVGVNAPYNVPNAITVGKPVVVERAVADIIQNPVVNIVTQPNVVAVPVEVPVTVSIPKPRYVETKIQNFVPIYENVPIITTVANIIPYGVPVDVPMGLVGTGTGITGLTQQMDGSWWYNGRQVNMSAEAIASMQTDSQPDSVLNLTEGMIIVGPGGRQYVYRNGAFELYVATPTPTNPQSSTWTEGMIITSSNGVQYRYSMGTWSVYTAPAPTVAATEAPTDAAP